MRPIRYRVWWTGQFRDSPLTCTPQWVTQQSLRADGTFGSDDGYGFGAHPNPEHYIIEQFTGLIDTTNRDIYEGDFLVTHLSIMGSPDVDWTGEVIWDEARVRFVARGKQGDCRELPLTPCIVVGNVHEGCSS